MSDTVVPLMSVRKAAAVTPNDSTDLTRITDAITASTAGNASVIFDGDSNPVTVYLLQGATYAYRIKRVRSTGTSASGIVALYEQ